jgi:hypothetical protein
MQELSLEETDLFSIIPSFTVHGNNSGGQLFCKMPAKIDDEI